jgi:SWI/SNF-related matrix-associated actin-dependent regulator 1 of chromatin subfamily A
MDFELNSWDSFKVNDERKCFQLFTSIPGYSFNSDIKKWVFPLKEYDNVVKQVSQQFPMMKIKPIPKSVLNLCKRVPHQDSLSSVKIDLSRIEPKIKSKLMPFQVEGVETAIRWKGRILIADEMGVGKSIQALAISSYYRREWPLLIICPSSLVASWNETVKDWMPSLNESEICPIFMGKVIEEKLSDRSYQVYIMSYDMAVKGAELLKKRRILVM